MTTKSINYYGTKDNYIHLKFGDCRKAYNFTKKFIKYNPDFAKKYQRYFETGQRDWEGFRSPFEVVAYAFKKSIPVQFYYNFTDTPATDYNEIIAYLVKENTFVPES